MTKLKILITLTAVASTLIFASHALAFGYNPFEKYGKWLPWSEITNWTEGKAMILTKTPNSHMIDKGYYAQDFGRFLESWTLSTKVHVISDGVVERIERGWGVSYFGEDGNHIVIDHGNGYKSQYSHLGIISLSDSMVGKTIRSGTEIGMIGETGNVSGPNLEFVIMKNGATVKAFDDGRPFQGEYKVPIGSGKWEANWHSPVTTFDYLYYKFLSHTTQRPPDPDNPWDPAYFDPLMGYLENYGYMFPSAMLAEPVNAATGNFVHRNVDIDLKTQIGLELTFKRFYNSLDDYQGPMGRGWSDAFDIKILAHKDPKSGEENQAYLYSVKFADGRGETFKETDNDPNSFTSTFTNETDFSLGTLERLDGANGYKFKYTSPDKTVYIFNSDRNMSTSPSTPSPRWGKVEKITDVNGHSLYFEYDATGLLGRVVNDFGQYLRIFYSGSRLITKVIDEAGREVNYFYNFDGRLAQVRKTNGETWNYEYDAAGKITKITDAEGKLFVKNQYDSYGRVIQQTDGNGGIVTFSYEKERNILGQLTGNQITKFTDANGNILEYKHNSDNYCISEKQALGTEIKYEYNVHGRVTKKILPEGEVTAYERDSLGNITKETKPDGSQQFIEYNNKGLPTQITDATGTIKYEYDANGNVTKQTDQKGNITKYIYDAKGLLTKIINSDYTTIEFGYNTKGELISKRDATTGAYLSYVYDNKGNQIEVKDAYNNVTRFEYDTFGNVTKIINPKMYTKQFIYDKNGNLAKEIDEVGAVTTYFSDSNENITKIIFPNGAFSEYQYDRNNNKIEEKDPNGNIKRYYYDTNNRVIKLESYDNNNNLLGVHKYEYNKNGRNIKYIDAKGLETKYEYDSLGRLTKEINAMGFVKEYKYSSANKIIEEKDYENNIYKHEYDSLGNKTKDIDPLGNETIYEYDSRNNLVRRIDSLGGITEYFYNSIGKVVAVENAEGYQSRYEYDRVGNLVKQTNFAGETTFFEYDANNNLTKQSDELGNTIFYAYDSRDNLARTIDPNGNITRIEYDLSGNKSKEINAQNSEVKYEYDNNGNLVKFTGENNISVRFEYDGLNRKIKEFDQNGNAIVYNYDPNGNIVKITDRNGNKTSFNYDSLNRLTEKSDALGQREFFNYSPNGNLILIKDKLGFETRFEYDKLGNVVKIINPLGFSMNKTYDSLNRLILQTDFKGAEIKFEYDDLGNVTRTIDRSGNITTFTYDNLGRILTKKNSLGQTFINQYDDTGRLVKEINEKGNVTEYFYDKASNIISVKNARGFETRFEYDVLNRKIKTIDPIGASSVINYDSIGRITNLIDKNGNSTKYIYDNTNNIIQIINANGGITSFKYDNEGNLVKTTNPRGNSTKYEYDALNRKIKTTLADSAEIKFEYDGLNRIIKQTDPKGNNTIFAYDAVGNLTKETDHAGFTSSYKYDENNNLVNIIDKLGNQTVVRYNANDLVTSITNPLGGEKNFEYDSLNRKVSEKNERGVVTTYAYDEVGNIKKIKDALGAETIYEYDPNNNISKIKNAFGFETNYVYDSLDRLTQEINPNNTSKIYAYDNVGNILAFTDENGNISTYAYDKVYNKKVETNALSYSTFYNYDANDNLVNRIDENGNMVSFEYDVRDRNTKKILSQGETYFYEYDKNGNLVKQTNPKGNNTIFAYDERDLLTKKIDPLGNAETYEYDGLSRLVKETNPEGSSTSYYYDSLSRLIKVVDPLNAETSYEYDEAGNLLRETNANGKATIFEYDSLNRKIKEVNPIGSTWQFEYNSLSLLTKKTDANNNVSLFNYDELNRLTKMDVEGGDEDIAYEYDNVGNITKVSNKSAIDVFTYDSVYRIVKANSTHLSANTNYEINYAYDPAGNKTRVTYPDGKSEILTYNSNNQIIALSLEYTGDFVSKESPIFFTTTFDYDQNQNLVKQVNPNNTQILKNYDQADRLTSISHQIKSLVQSPMIEPQSSTVYQPFAEYTYEYNKNGDRVKESILEKVSNEDTESSNNTTMLAIVKTYEYDPARRLTKVTQQKSQNGNFENLIHDYYENYTYDAVGNRTRYAYTSAVENNIIDYTYNDANELVEDTFTKYTYDANGNRLTKVAKDGSFSYKFAYNKLDQLVKVESKNKGLWDDKQTEKNSKNLILNFSYEYDGLGRRIAKVNNTDYTNACPGGSENGKDKNPYDCNNGKGDDDKGKLSKKLVGYPLVGTNRIDYVYDNQSMDLVSEYYTRDSRIKDNYDLHTNCYDASVENSRQVTLIAKADIAKKEITSMDLSDIEEYGEEIASQEGTFDEYHDGEIENKREEAEDESENPEERADSKNNDGSITVCITLIDADDKVVDGTKVPQTLFSFLGYLPEHVTQGKVKNKLPDVNVTTPIKYNKKVLSKSKKNDAYCVKFDNLEYGDYYYQLETASVEGWEVRYNDAYSMKVNSLDDFYDYQNNIFDDNPNNDEERNLNVDGRVIIKKSRKDRTIYILNKYTVKQWIISPESIENISYYHREGLDSIVSETNLEVKYKAKQMYGTVTVDPTPIIEIPKAVVTNQYNAYGIGTYTKPSYPKAKTFTDWSNRTYSSKTYDIETGMNYYGSRYYDSGTGVWNKQDSYRGTILEPMSRHRYMFVNDNPVNNVDRYGYSPTTSTPSQTDDSNRIEYTEVISSQMMDTMSRFDSISIDIHSKQAQLNTTLSSLPALYSHMKALYWSARYAKHDLNNHTQMAGVIGRLETRGYDLDYNEINNYLSEKIIEKSAMYARKQAQYIAASNTYYREVNRANNLVREINSLTIEQEKLGEEVIRLGDMMVKLASSQTSETNNTQEEIRNANRSGNWIEDTFNSIVNTGIDIINAGINAFNLGLDITVNVGRFVGGFAYEVIDNVTFDLPGMLLGKIGFKMEDQTGAFQLGATGGRIFSMGIGIIEIMGGGIIITSDAILTTVTFTIGNITCPVTGGLGCAVAGGALVIEIPIGVVGVVLIGHGVSTEVVALTKENKDRLLSNVNQNVGKAGSEFQGSAGDVPKVGKPSTQNINNIGPSLRNQSTNELIKSRQSFENQIQIHTEKINNPEKYIDPLQIKGDPELYKKGLVEKWQNEINIFQDRIAQIDYLLNNK